MTLLKFLFIEYSYDRWIMLFVVHHVCCCLDCILHVMQWRHTAAAPSDLATMHEDAHVTVESLLVCLQRTVVIIVVSTVIQHQLCCLSRLVPACRSSLRASSVWREGTAAARWVRYMYSPISKGCMQLLYQLSPTMNSVLRTKMWIHCQIAEMYMYVTPS